MREENTENRDFCIKVKSRLAVQDGFLLQCVCSYFEVLILADGRKSNIKFKCNPSSPCLMRIFPG